MAGDGTIKVTAKATSGNSRITVKPHTTQARVSVTAPTIQARAVRTLPARTPAVASAAQTSWAAFADSDYDLNLEAGVRTKLVLSDNLTPTVSNLPGEFANHDFFVDGNFAPVGITPGGKYRLRLNVDCTSLLINNDIRFELDIGGSQGVVDTVSESCHADAGDMERITPAFDFYTFGTFIANGGAVYVTSRTDSVIDVLQVLVIVERTE